MYEEASGGPELISSRGQGKAFFFLRSCIMGVCVCVVELVIYWAEKLNAWMQSARHQSCDVESLVSLQHA